MKKIKISIWIVPLSYNNMFKQGDPLDIKKDNPFWYPNHASNLTQMRRIQAINM